MLVANAAYSNRLPWHQISAEQWDHTHAVNLRGAFLCAQACREGMLRAGGGSIISVTSVTVELGMAGLLDYVSSKAGLIGFTRALAREVGSDGIRVNAVRPGFIHTDIHASGGDPNRVERLQENLPMRRGGRPEEVAEAVVWLLSDQASYVTGSFIDLAGGK